MIITNAFSINMLKDDSALVRFEKIPAAVAANLAHGARCAIGHADTARLVAKQIASEREDEFVEAAKLRLNVSIGAGDRILVAQYRGPRLPEGATQLPEGATIEYFLVEIN